MSKFGYKIIIDDLPQTGVGQGEMYPDVVVVHHSAFESESDYDIIQRLSGYADNHINKIGNTGFAYHFYIPRIENDKNIYITRYLNQIQMHCSNTGFNNRSVAILVEGNFETQKPTTSQLQKLKQLLDDLENNSLFPDNPFIRNLKPKDSSSIKTEEGKTIYGGLSYHSEVAEDDYGTKCCGQYLVKFIKEYKNIEHSMDVDLGTSANDLDILKDENKNLLNELNEARQSIKGIMAENTSLQNELNDLRLLLGQNADDIRIKLDNCIKESAHLRSENAKLKAELGSSSLKKTSTILSTDLKPIDKKKLEFMQFWNRLPVFIRYIVPNIISLAIPSLILYIQSFDFSSITILGIIGISHTAIKSLVIGYLKNLDKKLKGNVSDFEE